MKFVTVAEYLNGVLSKPNASEFHGLITGWLCAGSNLQEIGVPEQVYAWLESDLSESNLVSELFETTRKALGDPTYGFQLLLPGDEAKIGQRQQYLSLWCTGFLSGFGMAGQFEESELAPEVAEIFGDFARIAAVAKLGEEVPEDEENEADLMEIGEFVRISALLVFSEGNKRAASRH